MEFTKVYNDLKKVFSLDKEIIPVENSNIEIHSIPFKSTSKLTVPSNGIDEQAYFQQAIATNDEAITENMVFKYPVFVPKTSKSYSNAIILLHGLNEKSWLKYLPWAYYLTEKTNRPVILFPISFHMNRCPESWANPRSMMPLLSNRQKNKEVDMSTFANVSLSQRLSDEPLRFFTSGRQSAEDIISLLESIKRGEHPFLAQDAKIDFFSYSIGAFLSEVMFLSNPKDLLSDSRLFMFCGGALFSEMYGTSRLIMDSQAYSTLRKYYLKDFVTEMRLKSPFSTYIKQNTLGRAFFSMIAPENFKSFREDTFIKLRNQIRIITLKNDKVIPSNYIEDTFAGVKNKVKHMIDVLDFPFEYSHETPFPILANPNYAQVDQCFERVFRPAVEFLR